MKKMFVLLVFLTTFPALSTDMYLPAIPMLQQLWHQPMVVVNLTLIGFFITFCLFILIYGPISDRYCRRPPLLVGISLYIIASVACATAPNIHRMIAARILQGAGAAAASTMAMASGKLITAGFLGILCSGLWMVITPHHGPWDLALPNWIICFSMGLCRPPSNNLALELVDRNDAGTASSLIMSTFMIMGITGMWLISLDGFDKITLIGSLAVMTGVAALAFWLPARRGLLHR